MSRLALGLDDGRAAGIRGSAGFTLIELMVTLAVLAVLLGIAIPSFTVSERASHLAGGYPVMRQQLGQGAGLLRRQAHEHVLQVGVRIVSVQAG